MTRTPQSNADRMRASRARGRPIAITLRDPEAIAALARAAAVSGGIRHGIEAALIAWIAGQPEPVPAPVAPVIRRPRGAERPGGAASAPGAGQDDRE
jgi:hypothetical protein